MIHDTNKKKLVAITTFQTNQTIKGSEFSPK